MLAINVRTQTSHIDTFVAYNFEWNFLYFSANVFKAQSQIFCKQLQIIKIADGFYMFCKDFGYADGSIVPSSIQIVETSRKNKKKSLNFI